MTRRPLDGGVRNPVTGRSDGYTGFVPCPRLGNANVPFESLLERDFIVVTQAFERDVVRIQAQPMRLEVPFEGAAFDWIPDFMIERRCGERELVETKPLERVYVGGDLDVDMDDGAMIVASKFGAMEDAAAREGFTFRLTTEEEIRVEPRLRNAKLLYRYASDLFPSAWTSAGLEAITQGGATSIADLGAALPVGIDKMAVALRLAWLGLIEFDPGLAIDRHSAFSRMGSGSFGEDRT